MRDRPLLLRLLAGEDLLGESLPSTEVYAWDEDLHRGAVMSWFRRFIRQHLIADDPASEYSRLDHHDGLQEKPPNTQEPGSDLPASSPANTQHATLAAIQKRITADEDEYIDGLVDQSVRDRLYLLALVRDQAAALAAVKALADYLETLAEGDRHYAALIRDALTATEGA